MMQNRINFVLLVLLALVTGLTLSMHRDSTLRNVEIMPGMFYSIPFEAHSANPNFADGKTLRSPSPGTIIRGTMPLDFAGTEEDAKRAAEELSNPYSITDELALRRGEIIFARLCQSCHGASGRGDGSVTQHGFPPPASLLADNAMKIRDGQMFHTILFGKGNMPSLASQVSQEDAWKAILAVRNLQQKDLKARAVAAEVPQVDTQEKK